MQHPPTYLPPWVLLLFSIIRHAERSMTASRPGHRRQWLGRGKGGEDMATVPRNGTVSMLTGARKMGTDWRRGPSRFVAEFMLVPHKRRTHPFSATNQAAFRSSQAPGTHRPPREGCHGLKSPDNIP